MVAHRPIICDTGTGMIKAGIAGDHFPRLQFPTMLGRPTLRFDQEMNDSEMQLKELMIGDEVISMRSMLEISRPIENGVVRNWDDMEKLWDYTFEKLGITNPPEHRVVQTEAAMNPTHNRERMIQ